MRRLTIALVLLASSAGERAPLPAQPASTVRVRFAHDTVVAGVSCGPTGRAYAVLFTDGRLEECPLAVDTVIAGHLLPHGTWILLDRSGRLASGWLAQDTDLQGIPCRGRGYKTWHMRFHPDGHLATCFLSQETTIDGVPCRAGSFWAELWGTTQVQLHPTGHLRSCRVAREVQREGTTIASGRRITLSDAGRLVITPES